MRRKDFFEFQQFNIHQGNAGMKVGTDSDLLGTLSEGGSCILDIGTGTGVLSLMLAQRYPQARITAIEIDDDAVKDAEVNFAESKFANRIQLHHISFQDYLAEYHRSEMMKDSSLTEYHCADNYINNSLSEYHRSEMMRDNSLEEYHCADNHINDSLAEYHCADKSTCDPSAKLCRAKMPVFDSVVCNPPYFHNSLECPDERRLKARHTSSLPFEVLVSGVYDLLCDGGSFSVCIPPEVLDIFTKECIFKGFSIKDIYSIKSVPELPTKRYVLVLRKGSQVEIHRYEYCMRNSDRTISDWYKQQMKDFHKSV